MWLTGEIEELFHEADVERRMNSENLMSAGKISNALICINDCEKGGVLSLTEKIDNKSVLDILKEKHPADSRCDDRFKVEKRPNVTPYHPNIFDKIQRRVVRNASMKTHGIHGPSAVDAYEWRHWLSNCNQSSTSLCRTVARIAMRIATEEIVSEFLEPYNACRLIPLDKNPAVRPIGVGEFLKRIIGRSTLRCIQNDLRLLGTNQQLCLGQNCGIEHVIHSLRNEFEKAEVIGNLVIDAKNAFNSLNRDLALRNIENMCPSIVTALKKLLQVTN